MHFLFPSDPLNPRKPDELFSDQVAALSEVGFTTSLLPDAVVAGAQPLRGVPAGEPVLYRGWMLTPAEYSRLATAIEAAGGEPFTPPSQYVAAHYLPNWYPLVREFTPETRVYPAAADLVAELQALDWDGFFIKDYVKSLKTSVGSLIRSPELITQVVEEMKKYRGEIEGGVCVRRVEDLLPETERRYFVVDGHPHAAEEAPEIPVAVRESAGRIGNRFFSIDAALRRDGEWRIVEIGDGQVSDLVGWSVTGFAELWASEAPAR